MIGRIAQHREHLPVRMQLLALRKREAWAELRALRASLAAPAPEGAALAWKELNEVLAQEPELYESPEPEEGRERSRSPRRSPWKLQSIRNGRASIDCAQALELQVGEELLRASAPKWSEEQLRKSLAKLSFQVYAPEVIAELGRFDDWVQGQLCEQEFEGSFRSSLWVGSDPSFAPRLEVRIMTRGSTATRLELEQGIGGEAASSSMVAAQLLGLFRTELNNWRQLRFRVSVKPESVYSYMREGTRVIGVNFVATMLAVSRGS